MEKSKISRGNASQFFVAGELCRRGYFAVVTRGNTPNTDILCSDLGGTKFVHIQVKTFRPKDRTCTVGRKAEKSFGDNFFWVLSGIPDPEDSIDFQYYIIPASIMAKHTKESHGKWLSEAGVNGRERKDSDVRTVHLPPHKSQYGWDVSDYLNKWSLIEDKLRL